MIQTLSRLAGTFAQQASSLTFSACSQKRRHCLPTSASASPDCSSGYRFGPRMLRVDLDELDALMRPLATGGTAK